MKNQKRRRRFALPAHSKLAFVVFALCYVIMTMAQTTDGPTGVVRLRVRVATGDGSKAKGLARKRFFLIKGNLQDNQSLIKAFADHPFTSRDCYYRSIGASEELIAWLNQNDCESIYCREVDVKEAARVPEFAHALSAGEKEYGGSQLALQWLTTNLPDNIRSGFYHRQQQELATLLTVAQQTSKASIKSVMTDRNGTAYFTDLPPGLYTLSNILRTESGGNAQLWNCEVKVSEGDLATAVKEKPFLISDPRNKDPRDKRNIKCVSVEAPIPACSPGH